MFDDDENDVDLTATFRRFSTNTLLTLLREVSNIADTDEQFQLRQAMETIILSRVSI